MNITTHFSPNSIAERHSEKLLEVIRCQINISEGKISFADYMNLCLYHPGLGYYSAGSNKMNYGGDFTTAPEISPLFSGAFAHHVKDVIRQIPLSDILEFGAGSGTMAVHILLELERLNSLPNYYFIVEVSADLRCKQQTLIEIEIPHLIHLVQWLDYLPNTFTGVVLANEVCDAMPVHRLNFSNGNIRECCIEFNSIGELQWCNYECTKPELLIRAQEIQASIGDQDYTTEVNLLAETWLSSIANLLDKGAIFIVDYGYSKTSYYHRERTSGTLMCYYQHQGNHNPLLLPGLQDITAHINFSGLAETAFSNNLVVASFQSQADFLISGSIMELVLADNNVLQPIKEAAELKQLILPSEMGESFKVLTLTYNLDSYLPRIQLRNRRHCL